MFNPIEGGTCEEIKGLKCWIPPTPAIHLIDGYSKAKKEQKWKRPELPSEWEDWRSEEDFQLSINPDYVHPKIHAFVLREWDRRINGYWFFNNGKPVYLTGKFYFYLAWWKLDSGYADYHDPDRQIFYFWQYCIEDDCSYGMVEMTLRRDGKTYRGGSEMYEEISKPPGKQSGGIQSKTGSDAAELFEEKIIEPWKDLPDFFKPESNSGTDPKKRLDFRKNIIRGKEAKKRKQNENEELRSFIDYKPAKEKAYDGKAKKRLFIDEAGKTDPQEEADVYKRHFVLKPCLFKDGRIQGKMYVSTTVEELDKGGAEFKKLWDESDFKQKNNIGQTKSGLYRYFKSALEGTFYDEYGYPVIENPTEEQRVWLIKKYGIAAAKGARAYHQAIRDSFKNDPNGLTSYMRKHPFIEEEAFYADGDACEFNALVLTKRLEELQYKDTTTTGDFTWKNGRDSDVVFVPNPNGKWSIAWLPTDVKKTNLVEKGPIIFKNDIYVQTYKALNDQFFRAGQDPVDMGFETVDKRVSDTAMYIFQLLDITMDNPEENFTEENCDGFDYKIGKAKWKTNRPIAEYIDRADDPEESWEETIKAIRFFGCSIFPEINKPGLKNHLEKRGYGAFLKYRPKETWTNNTGSQNTAGVASVEPVIQQYLIQIKSYVNNYGHLIPFRRLVKDLLDFRRSKIRVHDPTVAFGFTLMATLGQAKQTSKPIELNSLFNTYSIKGGQSELIR